VKYFNALIAMLKKAGVTIHPAFLAVALLLIPLFLLYLKKRKANAQAAQGGAAAETPKPAAAQGSLGAPEKVRGDRFTKVWSRFKADLPPVVRRSLSTFAHFVVMGTDRSSTSRLINTYTDWERQARFLFGSHVDDPDLKIYLGSRVLLLDMPESVLAETSSSARKALLNLWRPLFRRHTPVVVVSLNPMKLSGLRPEQISDLADTIRGKINLLSWVRGKRIEVRVALTDLEELPGFEELVELSAHHKIPLEVELAEGSADYQIEGQLNERLAEFYPFITLGLADLPDERFSDRFTRLASFLHTAPVQLSPNVATFLAALLVRQPIGQQPILRKVYLTAGHGTPGPGNPFNTQGRPSEGRGPLFWHRVAAATSAVVLMAAAGFGYYHEERLWAPAHEALVKYMEDDRLADQPTKEEQLRTRISSFANRTAFPGFFSAAQEDMQRKLRSRIVELHIEPGFKDAFDNPQGLRRAIYLVALAYAAKGNDLGALTEDHELVRRWAKTTGLSEDLILDYVVSAERTDRRAIVDGLGVHALVEDTAHWDRESFTEWRRFFGRAVDAMNKGNLGNVDLSDLKDDAVVLASQLGRVEAHPDVIELVALLGSEDPELAKLGKDLEPMLLELQRQDIFRSAAKRAEMGAFLAQVVRTELRVIPTHRRLQDLCTWVTDALVRSRGAIEAPSGQGGVLELFLSATTEDDLAEFRIDDLLVREADWLRATRDDSVRQAIRRFLGRTHDKEADLFFAASDRFDALEMNPDTQGRFMFSGKARIPGRYTAAAVRDRVVPPLECLGQIWPRLRQVAPEDSTDLSLNVERELEAYANQYEQYLSTFYNAFDLEAGDSVDALRTILSRMLRPSSPFTRHLLLVAENSRLPPHGAFAGQYLTALKTRLEPFRVLQEVATSTKTADTPLGDYLEFLTQVQERLEPSALPSGAALVAGAPDAKAAPDAPLVDRLSPAGQLAYQMLTCGSDSVLARVEGWLEDVKLPQAQRGPFLSVVKQLYLVGRQDIEGVTRAIWDREVIALLRQLTLLFPFHPQTDRDATQEDITRAFHPVTGQITRVRQQFLDPISRARETCRFRYERIPPLPPPEATKLLPKLEALTQQLFDKEGQPKPLLVEVKPVAFDARLVVESLSRQEQPGKQEYLEELMTLTFLSSGTTTLVNFNQRPFTSDLEVDWTRRHSAQVGIRLTHPETRNELHPDRITEESSWALLRLLVRAETDAGRYTWEVPFSVDAAGSKRKYVRAGVSFDLTRSPFEPFRLTEALEQRSQLGLMRESGW
jgi:hypothetical protein